MEEFVFRRRNRLKKHFVNTSNVLLYGYHHVSDAAKVTYQVIDGFDWENKETGDSKGYVFPATDTLAEIRNTSQRTIRRHISELEQAGLLTRKRRSHKSSILIIEDVSEQEVARYIEKFLDGKTSKPGGVGAQPQTEPNPDPKQETAQPQKQSTDTNVRSQNSQRTQMSVDNIKKEKEEALKENNVNEDFKAKKRVGGLGPIGEILKSYHLPVPTQRKTKVKPDEIVKRDYLAETLANELHDRKSLGCYRVIADKVPHDVIFQVLGSVKETASAGRIRQSRGALFVSIVSRYAKKNGIDLSFNTKKQVRATVGKGNVQAVNIRSPG